MSLVGFGCGSRFNEGNGWVNIDFTSTAPSVIAHNLREGTEARLMSRYWTDNALGATF